jgi:hypothetical protein
MVAEAESATEADNADAEGKAERDKSALYSSVVYFHGMGSQRRYEETSRLIDRLDKYLFERYRKHKQPGLLANIKARVEPDRCRPGSEEIVGYVRTVHADSTKMLNAFTVRFYEVYWAPIMAEQKSPWAIVQWLFKQPLRPWTTLRTPWRERQRLRRATLTRMFETNSGLPEGTQPQDYKHLMALYDKFEGLDAQRRFPRGRFADFLTYIAEVFNKRPVTAKRCASLAKAWLAAYQFEELRNAVVLVTLAMLVLLLAGGVLMGILVALKALLGAALFAGLLERFAITIAPDWPTVSAIALCLVGLVGLGSFLTNYLGDVQAWATYQETDTKHEARNKVLMRSLDILTHVLNDPRCTRVTVVAHSLGTSIAHDALLALTRRNRSTNAQDPMSGPVELHKIEHFVTMGSPIDKIEYLFESYASQSHRYKRVVEAFRGDIGSEPFSRNGKPYIHWINFWDGGDSISGPLHSPTGSTASSQSVDNVRIASYDFPAPNASHGGYFDNKTVIETLYGIIYQRERSFQTLPLAGPNQGSSYKSAFIGPGGEVDPSRVPLLIAALVLPWVVLGAVIAWLAGSGLLASWAAVLAGGIAVVLLLSLVASKIKGQRTPL